MSDYTSKNQTIVIVDYGAGNLLSIERAFEFLGAIALVSSDPKVIASADKIVLPGVGAFPAAMMRIRESEIDLAINEAVTKGAYVLGICLGMQMLLSSSYEMVLTPGLSLINGSVIPIEGFENPSAELRIPHVGWAKIRLQNGSKNPLLNGVVDGESFYFLHSYKASPSDLAVISADVLYSGCEIPALLSVGNIFGCQFHPEKSGPVGLRVIKNFIDI